MTHMLVRLGGMVRNVTYSRRKRGGGEGWSQVTQVTVKGSRFQHQREAGLNSSTDFAKDLTCSVNRSKSRIFQA